MAAADAGLGRIELRLRELSQLFDSRDPSPFQEKNLDREAEQFIVAWARECPGDAPLSLRLHLPREQQRHDPQPRVQEAVANYFRYRADQERSEVRRILRQGRTSLFVGIGFLVACLLARRLLQNLGATDWLLVVEEGLLIVGWVAMWRPLELLLYDWWPVRHRQRTCERLSRMQVDVRYQDEGAG